MKIFLKDRSVRGLVSRHLVGVGFLVSILVMVGVVYAIVDGQQKNKLAIEKSCTLLNNAVIHSSRASTDPNSPSAALITGILTVIPSKYIKQYQERSKNFTTVVPLINCERVAEDPDSIEAVRLQSVEP